MKKDASVVLLTPGWGGNEIMAVEFTKVLLQEGINVRIYAAQFQLDKMRSLEWVPSTGNLTFDDLMRWRINGADRRTIYVLPSFLSVVKKPSILFSALACRAWLYFPFWGHEWNRGNKRKFKFIFSNILLKVFKPYVIGIKHGFFRGRPVDNKRSAIFPNFSSKTWKVRIENDKGFNLYCVGRIDFFHKQQNLLFRLMEGFGEARQGFIRKLIFIGDGPDLGRLKEIADQKEWVEILPWVNDAFFYVDGPAIAIIPSRFEGLPLVALEAMSSGVPVVATAGAGIDDLLPSECIFTEDEKSFKRALSWIAVNYEHASKHGIEAVSANYSYNAFYKSVAQWGST